VYIDQKVFNLSFEAGLQARIDFLSWLGLQAEALITMNRLPMHVGSSGNLVDKSKNYFAMTFPVLLKAGFHPGRFTNSPYGGFYLNLPLSSDYKFTTPPVGITGGLSIGFNVGHGNIFADARYAHDFSDINLSGTSAPSYHRSGVNISLGYEFGIGEK
jgi:hypothetical protein